MKKQEVKRPMKYVALPAAWVSAPLFPPLPQIDAYSVEFGDYRWTSGCKNSLLFTRDGGKSPYLRGFDIRHYDLIAVFISQYRKGKISKTGDLYTGYRGLLGLIGKPTGSAQQIKYISLLLDDLWNTNLMLENKRTGKGCIFRTLSLIQTEEKNGKKCLIRVQLDPNFISFIGEIEKYVSVRLDVKVKLPSLVAQSIYTYLPSRAILHTEEASWKIRLKTLMEALRLPVEKYPTAFRRKTFFTQHENSILSQLDGQPLSNGDKFRIKLETTKDKTDYNLCCWVEECLQTANESKVFQWWIAAGRSAKDYYERLSRKMPLSGQAKEMLRDMEFDPEADRNYFEMCQALYEQKENEPDFVSALGWIKYYYLLKNIENQYAYFAAMMRKNFLQENEIKDLLPENSPEEKAEPESATLP